ncbi:MAG: flippase-like domain-containing protein [Bifidobacteriaceae bacterium]|nr:flippase-like domain-containing protein [Bifidobacteriaceae bacterium]
MTKSSASKERAKTPTTEHLDEMPGVEIHDSAPQRVRDWGDVISIAISVLFVAAVLIIAVNLRGTAEGVESDVKQAGEGFHWLIQLPLTFLQSLAMVGIVGTVVIQLLLSRMWVQAISSALGVIAGFALAGLFSLIVENYAPSTIGSMVTPLHNWFGSGPFELFTALAAFLTASGRRTSRRSIKWAWNILFVLAAIVLVSSTITITSVLIALGLGRTIGLVFRFGIGTQSTGVWGSQLVKALQAVGVEPASLRRNDVADENHPALTFADDLSDMTRLYRVTTKDGEDLIVSVNDEQRHTVGYLTQLWQGIKFSGLSIRRDRSVRETTEHHFTMLMALERLGIHTASVVTMGESGESAFLVFASPVAGATSASAEALNLYEASDEQVAQILKELNLAHQRGITHRELTERSLGLDAQNHPFIAGWGHGDLASTHAHIQVDRVQMLALLATTFGIERTLKIAQSVYTDTELSSIAPFAQNVAVPQHTKTREGWNRHLLKDLREKLTALAPSEELGGSEPVELARFNLRKFVTIVLVVVAVIAVFTQLNLNEVISAVRNANPWWAVLAFALGIVSWCGSAVAFGVFIDKDMRQYDGILGTQAVASFTAVSMPAGVGPIAVNLQFLRKIGYSNTRATAIATADMVAEFGTTFLLFLAIGLFTGQDALSGALPGKTLIMIIGIIGALCGAAMLIPPARKWIRTKFLPQLKSYTHQLVELFSRPAILALSSIGSIVQNGTLALSFWVSLLAFGYHANVFETMFLFLLANAVGSAVPTPGGLGAVETALTLAFTGIGIPSTTVVPAALLFRVCTYWLRIPLGGLYMKYMERRGQL